MNEKLAKMFEEKTNEKLLKEKIEYFANLLKNGVNAEVIQKSLKISDNDYKTIYPLALKLAQ